MPQVTGLLAAVVVLLALAACAIPYHPLPGQQPYNYTPVPGGTH